MIHGALYRRSVIVAAGSFGETTRVGEDSEYHWRIVAKNPQCAVIEKTVGLRRIHAYGHLSVGRTTIDVLRQSNRALFRFVNWAVDHGVLTPQVARNLFRYILVCTIKLGSNGVIRDRNHDDRAIHQLARVDRRGYVVFKLSTAPRARAYYVFASGLVGGLRIVRNAVAWGKAFVSRPGYADM